MKSFCAAGLVCALCTASSIAAEPLPIGMVNVDRILRTHKPLLEKLAPLKATSKELDATVQVRQVEIEGVAEKLRKTQPGSPEQQRLQQQLIRLQGELQQFINAERQKLNKKEVTVYVALFRELDEVINKYAKAHQLKLVLRQYETSYDEDQPLPEILKALNRTILYEEGLDITDEILKAMEAKVASGER